MKGIAATMKTTPAAVEAQVERMFMQLATAVSAGEAGALDRLRRLHQAIVEREEQGETLSRMLPTGVADTLLAEGRGIGETERLEVTVLMSDIRGYTSIAEHADPAVLAGQLNVHRAEMNRAILGAGGTVMQYVGDAVMAVFGAPVACCRPRRSGRWPRRPRCTAPSTPSTTSGSPRGASRSGSASGLSTGVVAAALLGSEERVEYTLVGDAVNLCQRLQQFAEPGQTVLSEATVERLDSLPAGAEQLEPQLVKGRDTPVVAHRLPAIDHINEGVLQ